MARKSVVSIGTGYFPQTFMPLFCVKDQADTPHSAGRVLARSASGIHLLVKCRWCGLMSEQTLAELPAGQYLYSVRVTGEDGPHLPDSMRPIPYLEESFEVFGTSLQDAHERAEFAHSMKFAGHLVCYYINGEHHLDERF
jgi:hypothetical protein